MVRAQETLTQSGFANPRIGVCGINSHAGDHGTAFDITGTGKADERSLLVALQQAAELAPRPNQSLITNRPLHRLSPFTSHFSPPTPPPPPPLPLLPVLASNSPQPIR
ncbi:MAG: 4-hydroxythreonine-4-phosphate dehydrogenase PdxA [Verrucomicrobia bacterium]|nr:4-hydroxythreonine-4-phosphate dehydrogenase PdxA [Verrucomicrobiota bacterium]